MKYNVSVIFFRERETVKKDRGGKRNRKRERHLCAENYAINSQFKILLRFISRRFIEDL